MVASARRFAVFAFAAAVVVGSLSAGPAPAAAADITVSAAEQAMIRILNADRARAGLVSIRPDTRLMAIARGRAVDMATKHYFSHTQPDGRTVFDIIQARGITWYGAGEIIAWNTWPTLTDSANAADSGWLGSATHRAIIMSSAYNYLGVGLAVDGSGKKYWTGVFMKGPDRTGAWVAINPMTEPTLFMRGTAGYRTLRVSWRGADITLVVLTAGLRNYQVQRRVDGGSWTWSTTWTTSTSRSINVYSGHTYDVRVRACDRAGNCGSWATVTLRG